MEKLILGRESVSSFVPKPISQNTQINRIKPYSPGNHSYDEPIHGCAFSGASSVCTSIEGLTTILHAPRSCAHFTVQLDASNIKGACVRGYETISVFENPDVICTNMKEETMVFGGNNLLSSKIEEQISQGKKNFAIITACPPGIIGDDCKTVAKKLEIKYPDVRISVLDEDGNATGDFMQGVMDAGIGLLKKFCPDKLDTQPFTLNLVGVKTMSSSAQSELTQIKEILSKLGIKVKCVMPGFCTMEELENATSASANLKLNPDLFTDKVCMFLKDQYGIPTLETPIRGGMKCTADWIRCVAKFFDREEQGQNVIDSMYEEFDRVMESPRKILKGKRCCVLTIGGDVEWLEEAIRKSGMVLERAYILRRADYNQNLVIKVNDSSFTSITESEIDRVMKEIDELCPDILLAPATAKINPKIYQSRLPCAPATDPFAGKLLAEDWIRGILAPKEEGWRKDVA